MSYEMEYLATDENDEEVEVTVEYAYYEACRGSRENGMQMEPDEPAYIEILSVTDENGDEFELSENDTEAVLELGVNGAEGSIEDAKAEAQISAYESRMGW